MWYRKPKVSSCLELVRTGEIDPKDAREAFKLWGVDDYEIIEKTLNFVAKLAEPRVGKKKSDDINETDNPELGMIMSLLKGLGLQIPPRNESSTEDIEPAAAAEFLAPLLQAFEESINPQTKFRNSSAEGTGFVPRNSTILNAAQGGGEEED